MGGMDQNTEVAGKVPRALQTPSPFPAPGRVPAASEGWAGRRWHHQLFGHPLPTLSGSRVFTHVNGRPRANTAGGCFLLPTLCTPTWLRPGSLATRELTSMELAMLRHSSMPGISSCSTFRSLHRSVMVPEEPASLGEAGEGSGLAVGPCTWTDTRTDTRQR